MFYDLSKQEQEHAEKIKKEIDRQLKMIPDGEEKKIWEHVWAFEHDNGIEHIKKAKAMQDMYRA